MTKLEKTKEGLMHTTEPNN